MKSYEYRFELSTRISEGLFYEKVNAINYYDAEEIIYTMYPRIFIRKSDILNLHLNVNETAFFNILKNEIHYGTKSLIQNIIKDVLNEKDVYFSSSIYSHSFINSYHVTKKELADILFGKDVFSKKSFEYENNHESIQLYGALKFFFNKWICDKNNQIKPLRINKIKFPKTNTTF
jgi:hypothetical protein